MKTVATVAIALSILGQGAAFAALPDVETYNFAIRKYSLLMRQSRDGCAFYADPEFIVARSEKTNGSDKNIRQLIVLQTADKDSGSGCSGVFQFQYADVNCRTNQITYTDAIGSPASWKTDRYSDSAMTKKICALPTVEFATPTQNLPPAK
ncbi:MAG: hypothetical protein KME10_21155 [Plectolyngbya sp. WJT66-NPBG17]|jgi:hypothetical protein|nr:hypothetical protein [Plectolyngbya sp. WJT66-NPBG17]